MVNNAKQWSDILELSFGAPIWLGFFYSMALYTNKTSKKTDILKSSSTYNLSKQFNSSSDSKVKFHAMKSKWNRSLILISY
jgi:hypothetical protein